MNTSAERIKIELDASVETPSFVLVTHQDVLQIFEVFNNDRFSNWLVRFWDDSGMYIDNPYEQGGEIETSDGWNVLYPLRPTRKLYDNIHLWTQRNTNAEQKCKDSDCKGSACCGSDE